MINIKSSQREKHLGYFKKKEKIMKTAICKEWSPLLEEHFPNAGE